jgi:LPXTG-motif cell wall-anchored protein
MSGKRIGAGITGVAFGLIMFGGVAGAQVGTDQSDVLPNNETTTSTTVANDQLGEEVTAPEAMPGQEATTGAAAQAAPSGSLPLTGGDVVGLAVIGAAAVGTGAVLMRRSRTNPTA